MLTQPTRPPRLRPSGWALVGVLGLLGACLLLAGAWRQPVATASLSPLTELDLPAAAATVPVSDADEPDDTGEPVLTESEATAPTAPIRVGTGPTTVAGAAVASAATSVIILPAVTSTPPPLSTTAALAALATPALPAPTAEPEPPAPTAAPDPPTATPESEPAAESDPPTATPAPDPPTATPAPAPPRRQVASARTGPPRIGLQAGHWRSYELPEELARLRGSSGGSGGGRQEWEVNLEVAEAVAARLRARGYIVDVLPATIPPGYVADVFLSIHADASSSPAPRGFKIARSGWSRLPNTDDALVDVLTEEYAGATGLPWDNGITRNMTRYYAFNNRRRQFAIDKTTPGAIIEMGFLTNATDRAFLFNQTERVVEGITRGLVRFVEALPPPDQREQPATVGLVLIINSEGATARSSPSFDSAVMGHIEGGRRQDAPEVRGEWYGIWVAERNGPGWVHQSEATVIQVALP